MTSLQFRRLPIALLRFYQHYISPLSGPRCRYYPSCSNYAITAISRFGVLKGGILAIRRILRCVPWSKGGIDDVPSVKLFDEEKFRNSAESEM